MSAKLTDALFRPFFTNMNAGGDGFPTPFYDYQAYPKTRSYTFGLNVTF